ncbi:MAG: DNA translocase FtsK 4TM domain-containing protein [Lonepinella koalarum]|nr:DNA translocase FtsK 4TM domain-containing protein [Lonepinella koalarum]
MIKRITVDFSARKYCLKLLYIALAIFGFYLIIAWSSYSPIDNTWSVSAYQPEVINKAGALGAWIIDLFFVLFGKIGNILPFIMSLVPLYFLRSRNALSWQRFFLRLFGFFLMMMGLTVLASLFLDNSSYHLAGGVLGAVLVQGFLGLLGQFWLLVLSVILSITGFILSSGSSVIRLLVAFYGWLTLKNEHHIEDNLASEIRLSEDEEDIINDEENRLDILESSQEFNTESRHDLYPLGQASELDIFKPAEDLYQEQMIDLPVVSIQTPENLKPDFLQAESAVSFVRDLQEPPLSVQIPSVSISEHFSMEKNFSEEREIVEISEEAEEIEEPKTPSQWQYLGFQEVDISPEVKADISNKGLRTISIEQAINLFGDPVASEKPTTAMPSLDLLDSHNQSVQNINQEEIQKTSQRIEQQLRNFSVKATVKDVLIGPVVTRYELELQPGIKASKVTNIDTDLARALMFRAIRVAETIPDKPYIGIETPNAQRQTVWLRDVLDSDEFRNSKALLPMALGKDISGKPIVIDLAKTPHLLVAGSTGSGKSVGINTMILSLLFKVKPEEVKFIMIDPKVVELSVYNDIPHLLTEVVTDMKKAANALRWCVDEMERRYQLLSKLNVRNIEGFNERIEAFREQGIGVPDPMWRPSDSMETSAPILEKLSYIVVIVDEFADLMMVAGKQVEELIARLTQKARAVGIHVILATQRPSVDVITGLIKSNIPSRIAFTVVQRNDSRTILDQNGAEALLGRGDMLYLGNGTTDLVRVHGAFMTDDEVIRVAKDWRARGKPNYISSILESVDEDTDDESGYLSGGSGELDPLFDQAVDIVVNTGMTSASFLQRRLKIGFNRAATLMEQLEEQGIVSEMRNGKRELLSRPTEY